jgi:tetrahydromethanopterin S-methyltransferase subunit G
MSDEVANLTVEILKQIRTELKEGFGNVHGELRKTNERLDRVNTKLEKLESRVDNVVDMQNLLVVEHRKTNERLDGVGKRLDFFAEELIRMRTRDNERLPALESAVAALQKKVG